MRRLLVTKPLVREPVRLASVSVALCRRVLLPAQAGKKTGMLAIMSPTADHEYLMMKSSCV